MDSISKLNNLIINATKPIVLYIGRGNKVNTSLYDLTIPTDRIILTIDIRPEVQPDIVMDFDNIEQLKQITKFSIYEIVFDHSVLKFFKSIRTDEGAIEYFLILSDILTHDGSVCFPPPVSAVCMVDIYEPIYEFHTYTLPKHLCFEEIKSAYHRVKTELDFSFTWDKCDSFDKNFMAKVDAIYQEEQGLSRSCQETYKCYVLDFLRHTNIFPVVERIKNGRYPYFTTDVTFDTFYVAFKGEF